jgi:hypothetical protein
MIIQGWSWLVTKWRTSLYEEWTNRKGNHDVVQKHLWGNIWLKEVMPRGSPEPKLEHKNALKPLLCKWTSRRYIITLLGQEKLGAIQRRKALHHEWNYASTKVQHLCRHWWRMTPDIKATLNTQPPSLVCHSYKKQCRSRKKWNAATKRLMFSAK